MRLTPVWLAIAVMASACSARQAPSAPSTDLDVVEEPVVFFVGDREVHGTWTQPDVSWRTPAVLLIAGSGPTDRDWNSPLLPGTNGSGALLAHELAERGVASLRYDKFGLTPFDGDLSWEQYTAEQQSGLALMAARDDVAGVWVAGHSEGGLHALALAEDPTMPLEGVILLATPGRPMRSLLVEQVGSFASQDAAATLDAALGQIGTSSQPVHVADPDLDALLQSLQFPQTLPYIQELLTWDPTVSAASLGIPMLVISGDKDIQVSAAGDTDALEAAARSGSADVTRVTLPHSDHTFKLEFRSAHQLGAHSGMSYNNDDRQLDAGLPDAMAAWIYR